MLRIPCLPGRSPTAPVLRGLLAALLLATLAGPAAAATVTTVMSGLDNPRGMAFGPEGGLYVAEAGRGGAGPCTVLRGQLACYGPSGALTRLWRGTQQRVATGLPSYLMASLEAAGPHDVSFQGRGGAFVTIGFGGDPNLRAAFGPVGQGFGTLVQVPASGRWRFVADVSAHEIAENPGGGPFIDSNPFGIEAEPGGQIVVDAGANALLRVASNGQIETLAVFPSRLARSTDAVPTDVALGPDGAWYVSELTGVPFTPGAARVYRVVPGLEPEIWLQGFDLKTLIDLAWGPDGSLYLLEHATGAFFSGPGRIRRVDLDAFGNPLPPVGVDTGATVLDRPTSLLVDDDGTIYVTNHGVSIGTGEVLKIVP